MKKIAAFFGITLMAMTFMVIPVVYANEDCEPVKQDEGFIPISDPSCFGDPPNIGTSATGEDMLTQLLLGVYTNIKYIISALAVAFLIYNGFRFVTAQNNEETINEQKRHLLWAFIGVAILAMAWEISEIFQYRDNATFLDSATEIKKRINLFDDQVKIILAFGRYIIGSITILYMVRSGARLVTSGHNDETVNKEKHNFAAAIVALIIIMISDFLINSVLFRVEKAGTAISGQGVEPAFNVGKGVELIGQITNFVASFAGPVAILMLVISALLYVTAGGEEEKMNKAKTLIKSTIIGLIVIYGAYAIVATFIVGSITG